MAAHLGRLADRHTSAPYARTLGLAVADLGAGRACLRLPHRDDNGNRNGSLHGGVLASLVAMGGGLAAALDLDDEATAGAGVVDLAVHYVRPAARTGVAADATVVRRGREIVFVAVDVSTTAGAAVARGMVACRIGEARRPPRDLADHPPVELPEAEWRPARASGSPFTRRLGVRVARLSRGRAAAVLPDQPATAGDHGRVHEGALAALVDCAAGASAWSAVGDHPRGRAATVAMHLAYDLTTRGEDVLALATTAWRSASLVVVGVHLTGHASGRPIATGSVTYRIVRPPD